METPPTAAAAEVRICTGEGCDQVVTGNYPTCWIHSGKVRKICATTDCNTIHYNKGLLCWLCFENSGKKTRKCSICQKNHWGKWPRCADCNIKARKICTKCDENVFYGDYDQCYTCK